ncbi:MAG: S-layer homology domain-containing protein, partial [Clostridia bacterium]|nr:S-layer homology domain-containing protein [Clostridia bacterium]
SDVPSSHWGATYIKIVLEEGLFELENDCFRPDEYITVEESVIAALKMMGKYSENYMDVARENGLFKNISEENIKRNITRAEFVQLLYNTKL